MNKQNPKKNAETLRQAIIGCKLCPRLRNHCKETAQIKRKAFLNDDYWGLPVPGFGTSDPRLFIVGLAPAAHGANRTGRMFTGDRSGQWLYQALYKAGFANQAHSENRDDGLQLIDCYVAAVARCAPPDNKPTPAEIQNCLPYLETELRLFQSIRVIIALGQIALSGLWQIIGEGKPRPKFAHGNSVELTDGRTLLLSYHPSQQNTFTGRLTEPMFDSVFNQARKLLTTQGKI